MEQDVSSCVPTPAPIASSKYYHYNTQVRDSDYYNSMMFKFDDEEDAIVSIFCSRAVCLQYNTQALK